MSIGGIMRTSVSGMNAQANRLSAVSENIANSSTTGYKRAVTEFSSLVLQSGSGEFNSGVVNTQTRNLVSQQGGLQYTTNSSSSQAIDLAIQGKGFLVVGDGSDGMFLTRAGSFVKDGSGNLVNAAGFTLQGYPLPATDTKAVANGYAGLVDVNLNASQLRLKPTDTGSFRVNLLKEAPVTPTPLAAPGVDPDAGTVTQADAFAAGAAVDPAAATSLQFDISIGGTETTITVPAAPKPAGTDITIDDVVTGINAAFPGLASRTADGKLVLTSTTTGQSVELKDIVPTNSAAPVGLALGIVVAGTLPSANLATARPTSSESMVVYDNTGKEVILDIHMTKTADNTWEYAIFNRDGAATGATAPFPYAAGAQVGTTTTVIFDASGQLATPATKAIDFTVPGGQPMKLNLTGTTQLSSPYQPLAASVNGNPPGNIDQIKISADGVVSATFASGEDVPLFKIPLALVESPDNMKQLSGNIYSAGVESGSVLVGFGGESGLGSIVNGALEQSTVDLASELTTMIESQRSYTANSKVFQTGSEILDVLVNLKR